MPDFDKEIKFFEASMNTSQIFSFDASYEPIAWGKPTFKSRPEWVSLLNLDNLSAYKSTSENQQDFDLMRQGKMHFQVDVEKIIRKHRSFDDIFLVIEQDDI